MIFHATGIICWSPLTIPPLASPLSSSRRFSFSLTLRSLIQCSINFVQGERMRPTFILLHVDIHFAQHHTLKGLFFPQPISDNFYKTIPGCKCVAVLWGLPLYCIHLHVSKLSYFPIVNFSVLNLLFTFKKQSSWPLIPFPLLLALPPALVQGVICFTYRL